jgi:hypothetical protein
MAPCKNTYFGPYSEIICQKPATSVFYFVISPVFGGQCMLVIFLEMLIVLHTAPVAAPMEAEGLENLLAEVGFVDFVGEIFSSVHIVGGSCWLNGGTSDAGVLQGVDVDSHAEGVSRQGSGSRNGAVIEA